MKDHQKTDEAYERSRNKVKEYEANRAKCKDGWCVQKLSEARREVKD